MAWIQSLSAVALMIPFGISAANLKVDDTNIDLFSQDFAESRGTSLTSRQSLRVFKVAQNKFNASEFNSHWAKFGIQVHGTAKRHGKIVVYSQNDLVFKFDGDKSEFSFSNERIPDLRIQDLLPDDMIQAFAEKALEGILHDESKNYRFCNWEKNMFRKDEYSDPVAISYYANFDFLLDGRPVLNGLGGIRLCFGEKGTLKEIVHSRPIFSEVQSKPRLPTDGIREKLRKASNDIVEIDAPVGKIPVLAARPLSRTSSYSLTQVGSERLLIPSISFLTEMALDPFTIHSSADPDFQRIYHTRLHIPEVE